MRKLIACCTLCIIPQVECFLTLNDYYDILLLSLLLLLLLLLLLTILSLLILLLLF